eukprot:gene11839-13801_t
MNRRSLKIIGLVLILAFTAYEELSLRPYLLKHKVQPEFIGGSLPNFLAVLIVAFLFSVLKDGTAKGSALRVSIQGTAAMVLYEVVQLWMPQRTFDWLDIAASLLAGLVSFFLLSIIDHSDVKKPVTGRQKFIAYYITDGRNASFKLRDIPDGVDMVILFGVKYWQYQDTLKNPAGQGMMGSYKSYGAYFKDIKALQKRGIAVLQNVDDAANWQQAKPDGYANPEVWASNLQKILVEQHHLDGISLDIEHSGKAPDPIPSFPRFEEIGYHGWYKGAMEANPNFLSCIAALTKYFGPRSGTKKQLQTASGLDIYSWDKIAAHFGDAFDYFQIQSYDRSVSTCQLMMNYVFHVNKIPASKMIFGAYPEGHKSLLSDMALAKWKPVQGVKGGIMVYTFNSDLSYSNAVLKALRAAE